MMRRKIYREENSEPGRYNEEALDYKPGIREHPPDNAAVRGNWERLAQIPKTAIRSYYINPLRAWPLP